VVGAGVGVGVNIVKNFDLYGNSEFQLGEAAKNGAAVGAALGGAVGVAGGLGAATVAGGVGVALVAGAGVGTIAMVDNLYNK
jgi:hypothetical protein